MIDENADPYRTSTKHNVSAMYKERTVFEVTRILYKDVERCNEELRTAISTGNRDIVAGYEFHARQLIRAIFAYIEATTSSVKASSALKCMEEELDITPQERYFANDTEYEINDRGELIENSAKFSLARNIRFALALNRKAHRVKDPFDSSNEWWNCMREAIEIRDRLTYPKRPNDLDVSIDEIVKVLKAMRGFEMELMSHNP